MSDSPPGSFLRVSGTQLVDEDGHEVILRGAGLGGWMNMENFIAGFPGREFQIREALERAIGPHQSALFFDKFLEYFFQDADARFFKSLGLNCLRLPFNYRHFEDDARPRVLKPAGFAHLDRVVDICARHGIYTILDLHAAPGGQNGGWHSDNPTHYAAFWDHKDFQDRAVWLWEQLAAHYRDQPWVAGYNPLNEPADAQHTRLLAFYTRAHAAIRAVDAHHVLFLDGNTYAADFSRFGDAHAAWPNTVYAIHDYATFGFPAAPAPYTGSAAQRRALEDAFERKRAWMVARGVPVWNGEWGPVYARAQYDGARAGEINTMRLHVLRDQLAIYDKARLSWSIWTFKDVDGFQGMIHAAPDTPYATLLAPFLAKKQRLALDTWGTDAAHLQHIFAPLAQFVADGADGARLYPPHWGVPRRTAELARHILVAELLVDEWADYFRGKTDAEIEALARSFAFESCVQREELNDALREFSRPEARAWGVE